LKKIYIDAHEDPVVVKTHTRVSEALLAIRENLLMACGGKGLCATCHVYVVEGPDCLSPLTPRERLSLDMLCDRQPNSRLACQCKVLQEGVKVALPQGRFISGTGDLERLIGRRAEEKILNPSNGAVLIAAGKIITRSRLAELAFVNVDIAEMRTRSLSHSEDAQPLATKPR